MTKNPLHKQIEEIINSSKIVIIIKGTKQQPRCGFSREIVSLLDSFDVDFNTFDVLENPEIRAEIKNYSNWPTFPQLYIDGELIGGLDIVQQMYIAGELEDLIFQ